MASAIPSKDLLRRACRFAVITALPKEFAVMCAMLEDPQEIGVDGDPNDYSIGLIPARDASGKHTVLVALQKKPANNSAAAVVSNIPRSFPNVEDCPTGRDCRRYSQSNEPRQACTPGGCCSK